MSNATQATKGVSHLYDAIETLLRKINDYLERVSIHLEPSSPPSPALTNILVDTLVHILVALALATRYCNSAVKDVSRALNVARAIFRRGSELRHDSSVSVRLIWYTFPIEDYFRVLVNRTGAQDVLDQLEALTEKERLLTAASSYAVIRKGELFFNSHSLANSCAS